MPRPETRRAYHFPVDAITIALVGATETGLIPTGSAVLLAVSGGADSMALLYQPRGVNRAFVRPAAGMPENAGTHG